MPKHLRLRIALVLVVVAVSVWYLYPLKSAINLGLDLQGGIHLMLGVEAERHVASQTATGPPRSRSSWRTRSPGTTPGPSSRSSSRSSGATTTRLPDASGS